LIRKCHLKTISVLSKLSKGLKSEDKTAKRHELGIYMPPFAKKKIQTQIVRTTKKMSKTLLYKISARKS